MCMYVLPISNPSLYNIDYFLFFFCCCCLFDLYQTFFIEYSILYKDSKLSISSGHIFPGKKLPLSSRNCLRLDKSSICKTFRFFSHSFNLCY